MSRSQRALDFVGLAWAFGIPYLVVPLIAPLPLWATALVVVVWFAGFVLLLAKATMYVGKRK